MIKALLRFWWTRSSTDAAFAMIDFAQYMTHRDLRQLADYLNALAADREI